MSLTLASAVFFVATSLVTTKIPRFGELIARRDFAALDASFSRPCGVLRRDGARRNGAPRRHAPPAADRGTAGATGSSNRCRSPCCWPRCWLNTIFFAQAVYLRAHKQEPLLGIFIASGIAVAASQSSSAAPYGATGMMLGYFVTTLVISLGGGTWVFMRKRREWHG